MQVFGLLAAGGFYLTTGQMFSDARTLHRKVSEVCETATEGEKESLVQITEEGAVHSNGTFDI